MKLEKVKATVIILVIAMVISLTGTFAWQSISQPGLGEAEEIANPGGRLHDDFSGYGANDTKDIYVENFGDKPIYARVRLDEYMEIGEGAGAKPGDPYYLSKDVEIVNGKPDADINDVTTWSTHIPDSTLNPGTPHLPASTANDEFHTYWTWYMGGQAEDNPGGKTVYMPTFNKNKDSLKADYNGTLAGVDKDRTTGDPYDDYHQYKVGETAIRVRDTDAKTYPNGSAYDIDADTIDECGPYGGAGGTGVEGENYEMQKGTHTAQETLNASVITMTEYWALPEEDQETITAWVYDVDGWAYWSQPIQPGTATGLLLDRIVLTTDPPDTWYYAINAVAQFITANDLGRKNDTGFYDPSGGPAPTQDALDLLFGIGVNTSSADGSITLTAHAQDEAKTAVNYAVQDMRIDLSHTVVVSSDASADQAVTWKLTGNTDPSTWIDASGAAPVLIVGANETVGGQLRIEVESTAYPGLKTRLVLPVRAVKYSIIVTADGDATGVLTNSTQGFTAKLVGNNFKTGLPQTFTWSLDGTYVGSTAIAAGSPSSHATLTVDPHEDAASVTVQAISTNPTYAASAGTGSLALPVSAATYTVDITDDETPQTTVTGTTVTIKQNSDPETYHLKITSDHTGSTPVGSWAWTSSNTDAATVSGSGTTATVTVPVDGTGSTTITATNDSYSPALTASFTVDVEPINYTITLTRMVESSYKDTPELWWSNYFDGKTVAFDVFKQADADGRIVYAAYDGSTVTPTDNVMVKATVTATDDPQAGKANAVDPSGVTVNLTLDGGTTPVFTGLKNTDGATSWKLSDNTLGKVPMNGVDLGAHTLSATCDFKNGSFTCAGINLTVAQPNAVINELMANNMHTTLGGVVNIDGTDFFILKKGSVTDSSGASHSSAALLLTKDQIGESVFGTNVIYQGNPVQSTVTSWVSGKSTLNSKAVPVTFKTRNQHDAVTPQTTSTNQKAFLLSNADIFGDANGTAVDMGTQTNCNGDTITAWGYGGPDMTAGECTPGVSLGELFSLIPDGRALRHGTQFWWLRSPRCLPQNMATVAYAAVAGRTGHLSGANYDWDNSGRYPGIRPALWYDLT